MRSLVAPIASDLGLDLYDVEQRGGTLRVTLDTPPGSASGVDLDTLALATRLVSRDLDHDDPMPGHYTLEVTSPGVERSLRTPAHFQRELGKTVAVRLADVGHERAPRRGRARRRRRRVGDDPVADPDAGDRSSASIAYDQIDRAKTVFEWGPQPKPGGPKRATDTGAPRSKPARASQIEPTDRASKEKQSS